MEAQRLVEIHRGGTVHRLLFDIGVTPGGCVENLRRLGRDPDDLEAIVCSHGHLDHTTGLSGLVRRLGRASLPVVIHPEFWTRRRIALRTLWSPLIAPAGRRRTRSPGASRMPSSRAASAPHSDLGTELAA